MGRSKTVSIKSANTLPPEAFDRIPRAQITFTDEAVYVSRFDERGQPTVTYPAAILDVAAAFNFVGARSGFLPPDTLFWNRAGRERIGIYLPPQSRNLAFDLGARKQKTLRVPLPGFVFIGQGASYWIYAVKERPASERAEMYVAPLPNVNGDNGLVCAGTVKFPVCAGDTIHAAANLFFESAFNHDLSNDKFLQEDEIQASDGPVVESDEDEESMRQIYVGGRNQERTLYQFLQELAGAETFPLERLVAERFTLKHLMQGEIFS